MAQDSKNTGAPSSDTTSALFVSARKKQLEQQEAERRAKEKEEQRLAAEAEVRRLEKEVEERKLKAEEDARRADDEARRIAEEARTRQAQAASNPDAILGSAQPQKKAVSLPQLPKINAKPQGGGAAAAEKPAPNKKMLMIIGGAVAAVALIAVIIIMVSGGGGGASSKLDANYTSSQKGISFSYPKDWTVDDASATDITLSNSDLGAYMMISDITNAINAYTGKGMDIVTAAETYLTSVAEGITEGMPVTDLTPSLKKSGELVTGSMSFAYDDGTDTNNVTITLETVSNRVVMCLLGTYKPKTAKKAESLSNDILATVTVTGTGGSTAGDANDSGANAAASQPAAPAGYTRFNSANGLTFVYPSDWSVKDQDEGTSGTAAVAGNADGTAFIYIFNYRTQAKDMAGGDAYNLFSSKVANIISGGSVTDLSDVASTQFDGMEQYTQQFVYNGDMQMFSSVVMFNDSQGNVQATLFGYPKGDSGMLDIMNVIMDSIKAA